MSIYRRLFDYAGVFPPASLPLTEAVARYRALRAGSEGWLVGPMLVRATQLGAEVDLPETGVIVDAPLPPDRYAQVESRCRPGEVTETAENLGRYGAVVYLESAGADPGALLTEIAAERRRGLEVRAKLRTGGLEVAAFPTPEAVARFVRTCIASEVPFKATAGLHHPFPTPSEVEGATEHGFINLLATVRAALAGASDLVACLTETDPAAFDVGTATWRGVGADLSPEAVRTALHSIGSCSIDEPAGYLGDLGVTPVPAS